MIDKSSQDGLSAALYASQAPSNQEVERVIDEVLAGEIDKYAQIVQWFQNDIWKIIAYMMHDISTTEDLVQQVFVKAYLALDQYKRGKDFLMWLKAIARNLVREEFRKNTRESSRLKVYREYVLARMEEDNQEQYEEGLKNALEDCKTKLSFTALTALNMRYTQSLGFEEIASKMNRTISATRQLLVRTRIALRNCIEQRVLP